MDCTEFLPLRPVNLGRQKKKKKKKNTTQARLGHVQLAKDRNSTYANKTKLSSGKATQGSP